MLTWEEVGKGSWISLCSLFYKSKMISKFFFQDQMLPLALKIKPKFLSMTAWGLAIFPESLPHVAPLARPSVPYGAPASQASRQVPSWGPALPAPLIRWICDFLHSIYIPFAMSVYFFLLYQSIYYWESVIHKEKGLIQLTVLEVREQVAHICVALLSCITWQMSSWWQHIWEGMMRKEARKWEKHPLLITTCSSKN
jgi:hypothetical protein